MASYVIYSWDKKRLYEVKNAELLQSTKDVITITNENKPQGPLIYLKFEKDLAITKELWDPSRLLIDDEENIYVYSDKALIKFNPQGVELSIKQLPRGQGPGEFRSSDPYFSTDGLLYIFDTMHRRLTVMDKNYEIQRMQKVNFLGDIFRLDSRSNMYFLVGKALPKTRMRNKVVLTKLSPSGKLLHEIDSYETGVQRDVSGVLHSFYYGPQMRYKIDSRDNIYYAMSDKYEINILSPEGRLIKKILKKGNSRKITDKEIEKYNPRPKSKSGRSVIDMPKHMPFIADIFVLDNGYLLVVTYENSDDTPTLAGDLIDEKGVYRARVQVPKYHYWYWLFQATKSMAVYKNNNFYTIEADEDEENYWVKRYRMDWKK